MTSGWRSVAAAMAFVLVAAGCSGRVSNEPASGTTDDAADTQGGGSGTLPQGKSGGKGGIKSGGGPGGSASGGASQTSSSSELPEKIPTERSAQIEAPKSANICGNNGLIDTGGAVQFPWAVQCLKDFKGDNGGEVYRGVYRDRIRVAYYISRDPVVVGATRSAGGCPTPECVRDYVNAYVEWFEKYYQTYGRKLEVVFVEGGGSESDEVTARDDARRIASIDPPVFAALNGPGQAGGVYAEELAAEGIVCFCTVSLPQEFYAKQFPYVWGTLMSSTQAYVHRAEYVGKRLAGRKAKFAGSDLLRQQTRSFALVYFNNSRGDYSSGVEFFEDQLAKYDVKLKKMISYTNIEGCQIDATNIINQLQVAQVTSVLFSGDPICPIHLTRAADAQGAQWEWIVTGSALTDTNNFGRLYHQGQWSRAFGVSMLQPDVKNEEDYWFKMYKEVREGGEPLENAPVVLAPIILMFTGVHLTGPSLSPRTFAAGMDKAIKTGGTVTLPRRSYGRMSVAGISFFDTNSYDDMTEIWWDPNQADANGRQGAYWFANGAHRYQFGEWPRSAPAAFVKKGAVFGYDNPPDQ